MELAHVAHLNVLIAAVEARSNMQVNLDAHPSACSSDQAVSLAGLLLGLSYFRQLGAMPSPATGMPVLGDLFGNAGRRYLTDVLFAGYGKGDWDDALSAWFPFEPSDRQLALARLLHARTCLASGAELAVPRRVPDWTDSPLVVPDHVAEPDSYRRNLESLLVRVDALPDGHLILARDGDPASLREHVTLGELLCEAEYFRLRGIVRHPDTGRPSRRVRNLARQPAGVTYHCEHDTLLHLFGTFNRQEPYDALFRPYGAGCWDERLLRTEAMPRSHKSLALGRIHFAHQFVTGALTCRLATGLRA